MLLSDDVLRGRNPLMRYDDTYALHDELRMRGLYTCESVTIARRKVDCVTYNGPPIRYRVNDGEFITQNTLNPGQIVPTCEVIHA